jgi:hypothetical protein
MQFPYRQPLPAHLFALNMLRPLTSCPCSPHGKCPLASGDPPAGDHPLALEPTKPTRTSPNLRCPPLGSPPWPMQRWTAWLPLPVLTDGKPKSFFRYSRRRCPPSTSAPTSSLTYKQQNTRSAHIGTSISIPPILTTLGASLLLTVVVTLTLPSFAFWLVRPAFWRAAQLSLTFFGSLYNPPSRVRRGQTLSLLSDRRRYPRAANT